MDAIFLKLLNMSITAGWLILAVIVLRLFLQRAPKWLSCVLWAIVAVRLVCPFSFESTFSLIPSAETVSPEVVRYAQEPVIDSGISAINDALNPIVRENFTPMPGASVNPLQIWTFIGSVIWAVGLAAMLGYALISCLRIRGWVRESVPLRDNIRLCDAVHTPFLLGIVRPRIYLPSGMDEKQMTYVLAHERAHIRRGDHFWKPFAYILLAVYWFHPLVWAAYLLFCRDVELACDEKAVKDMDLEGRKAYCQALLASSVSGRVILSYPLAFGEGSVKQRVKLVLRYRKPAFWVVSVAVVACAAVAVCFLTDPGSGADDGSQIRYLDRWYSKEDLSDETIEWLEWYNSLSEEEQLAVSSVPHDLARYGDRPDRANSVPYEPVGYDDASDMPVMTEDAPYEEAEQVTVESDLQIMFDILGISIHLPENEGWIQDREYRQPDENSMEISYHDAIADADCRLLAVKEGNPKLPEIAYEASLEETWEGHLGSGEIVYVKVQRSADGKNVLATWAYEEYQFAILADVLSEESSEADVGPVAKTALSIISNL